MSLRRSDFPLLDQGIYANTASSGLLSRPLLHWRRETDRAMLEGQGMALADVGSALENTRQVVANFLSAQPNQISLIPNFSWGMNAISAGLASESYRVLVLDKDYPSLNWPAEDQAAQVVRLAWTGSMEDRIHESISAHSIDVLCVSMVQWINGWRLDSDMYSKLRRVFPELLIIADATQFLGTGAFDFEASGIDVLGCSGYKWLLGGYGNGFFAFSDRVLNRLRPPVIGNNSTATKSGEREVIPLNRTLEPGHLDPLSFGSLSFSIEYLMDIGLDVIESHLTGLQQRTRERLEDLLPGNELLREPGLQGSIYWLPANQSVFSELQGSGIWCSWRDQGIRLSWHFYNSYEDIDRLFDLLKTAIRSHGSAEGA